MYFLDTDATLAQNFDDQGHNYMCNQSLVSSTEGHRRSAGIQEGQEVTITQQSSW